ncbi:WG repeat-containing protein [Fluviicola taffensis]|uniref:KWG Leptospira repeat protein n=1 Tax=Fluviicola taffensis (strain DSM 16823 / NCIMB 13979 / RW262) TaxID=755732 RepID=F2IK77_FLUTR|nr:WG repeat-containing protein [Fluviicola taffensis]AEA43980.1 hypothetical protein Fluta_1994 [Fluviicola taffensis DSM 16823]
MRGLLVFTALLWTQLVLSQGNVLPLIRDGHWSLIDTTGKTVTKTNYEYIEVFDNAGTAFALKNSLYGIINEKGEEIVEAKYKDIQAIGNGIYALHNGTCWMLMDVRSSIRILIDNLKETPEVISENWIELTEESGNTKQLLCVPNRKLIAMTGKKIHSQAFNYIYFSDIDTIFDVLDPMGNLLAHNGELQFLNYSSRLLQISDTNGVLLLLDAKGLWPMKEKIRKASLSQNELTVYTQKGIIIYDCQNRTQKFAGPYKWVYDWDKDFYLVERLDGFQNIIHKKTQKARFPYKYTSIWSFSYDSWYQVTFPNGNIALIKSTGEEVISGAYSYFQIQGDFLLTYRKNLSGIFSLKTNQTILPCIFNRISISEKVIKASNKEAIMALKIDQNHCVLDKMYSPNPVKILTQLEKEPNSREAFYADPRLLAIGWFVDSTLVSSKDGTTKMTYKWGLKKNQDSVLILPSFKSLNYVYGSYTFSFGKMREIGEKQNYWSKFQAKEAIFYQTGKKLNTKEILEIDTTDFTKRNFMRYATSGDFGILSDSGTFKEYDYLQISDAKILRACTDSKLELRNGSDIKFDLETIELNTLNFYLPQIARYNIKFTKQGINFNEGKWHYILPDGRYLNEKPLDYAFEFVGSNAICKSNGKWGVISEESVLIPFNFGSIERIIKNKDTFFLCKKFQHGIHIFDTSLVKRFDVESVGKNTDELSIFSKSGKQSVFSNKYELIDEPRSSWKLYDNGFLVFKDKKKWIVLDQNGNALGESPVKMESFFGDRYYLFKEGNKWKYGSLINPEFVSDNYQSISQIGDKLILESAETSKLINSDQQEIFTWKSGKVVVDSTSGNFAHTTKKSTIIYAQNGVKIAKIKAIDPEYFIQNALIVINQRTEIYNTQGIPIHNLDKLSKIQQFGQNFIGIKTDSAGWMLFDASWKRISLGTTKIRTLQYHGNHTFSYFDKMDLWSVLNVETNQSAADFKSVEGNFQEGSLLVKKKNRSFYLNQSLQLANNFTYLDAKPFRNGLASVKDSRGWTLINQQHLPISYPNFTEINYLAKGVFYAKAQPVHALYSSKGKELIPCEYERLKFISNKLVQCILRGNIYYFKTTGEQIAK